MPVAIYADVKKMVASLLNAAGYKMSATGAITSATGALVMSDAALTADDVGKSVAIDGAGAAGGLYLGTVSAVGSGTSCTVIPVAGTTVVGATVSYGGRLEDDRRNLQELDEAVHESDEEVFTAIGENYDHWARRDIETDTALTHNALIPSHIGAIGAVTITVGPNDVKQPGKKADFEAILRYRANTGTSPNDVYGPLAHNANGSPIGGFYDFAGNSLVYFSGSVCSALLVTYTRTANALQSPQIMTGLIVAGAVKRMPKEGGTGEIYGICAGLSAQGLAGIKSGSEAVPTIEQINAMTQKAA